MSGGALTSRRNVSGVEWANSAGCGSGCPTRAIGVTSVISPKTLDAPIREKFEIRKNFADERPASPKNSEFRSSKNIIGRLGASTDGGH
jgi:hypothetical protein